jgi:hypothetical protein
VNRVSLRVLLPWLLLCGLGSCAPTCGEIRLSAAPPASSIDFVVTVPKGASGIEVRVASVPENPSRPAWLLKEEAGKPVPDPLQITYGVVPQGMVEAERALPLRENALIRVSALYQTGSLWKPVCSVDRLYRKVGGRFVEAPEGE